MLGTPFVAGGLLLLFGGSLPARVLGRQPFIASQHHVTEASHTLVVDNVVNSLNVSSCPGTVCLILQV